VKRVEKMDEPKKYPDSRKKEKKMEQRGMKRTMRSRAVDPVATKRTHDEAAGWHLPFCLAIHAADGGIVVQCTGSPAAPLTTEEFVATGNIDEMGDRVRTQLAGLGVPHSYASGVMQLIRGRGSNMEGYSYVVRPVYDP
jgi:hypothetical protein